MSERASEGVSTHNWFSHDIAKKSISLHCVSLYLTSVPAPLLSSTSSTKHISARRRNDIAPPSINNQLRWDTIAWDGLPAPAWAHCLKIFPLHIHAIHEKTLCGPVYIRKMAGDPSCKGHKWVEISSRAINNSFNWNWTFVKVTFVLAVR